MKCDKRLLDLLLEKYERSSNYRSPGSVARGVLLKFDEKGMPDYWDELRVGLRQEINEAVARLAAAGMITVRYSRYQRSEVERIDLVLERVDEAYSLCGRPPRRALEERLASVAREWTWPDWRGRFTADIVAAVAEYGRPPAGLAPGEEELLRDLCLALDHLPGGEAEVPRRRFSQQVFGDSKRFESIESRLLRVLREYHPLSGLPDHELLGEVGIVPNPQQLLIAGPVRLSLDGSVLDIGGVGAEVGLPFSYIRRCSLAGVEADQVLTIENLTSFHEVVSALPPRTVVIYLGGYHQPMRRLFLELFKGLHFWHWGDIDFGGFQILVHLREQTGLDVQPWGMDIDTYRAHEAGGLPFDEAYGRRLVSLLERPEYEQFWPVIQAMLASGRKVEQESIRWIAGERFR